MELQRQHWQVCMGAHVDTLTETSRVTHWFLLPRVALLCTEWVLLSSWITCANPHHSFGGLNSLKKSYNYIFSIIRYLITWLNVLYKASCVNNDDLVSCALLLGFQKAHQLVNRMRKMFFSFLQWIWQARAVVEVWGDWAGQWGHTEG